MPTGFTAPLYDGKDITFEQFANSCLRAFGIYVRWGYRTDIGDYEVPDKIEPSDYHKKKYDELKAEYDEFINHPKSKKQLEKEYIEYVNNVNAKNEKFAKEKNDLRVRYDAMLDKVRKWDIPSEEYQGVKDFMEAQLTDSILHDCNIHVQEVLPRSQWIASLQNRSALVKDMNYHFKKYQEEVAHAAESTRWLKTFTESIKKVK